MSTETKSTTQVHRDIATILGNDMGNFGLPLLVSGVAVGLSIKPFKEDLPGLLQAGIYIGGTLLLAFLVMHFYVAFNGKRILGSIEKDYGPKTRQHVFNTFAEAQPGDKVELDIPAVARTYGEGK